MPRSGYAEILKQLEAFFELCSMVGLRGHKQGRFGSYQEHIRHLIEQVDAIRGGAAQGPLFAKLAPELPTFTESLAESLEVGRMIPFLSTFPSQVLKPLLTRVVRGPVLPSEEDSASNQARNIQFELALGAKLARTGAAVCFGEPDLRCQIDGRPFMIACKRILSPARLNDRIEEATKQVRRELRGLPDEVGGIVAISLSSVLASSDGKPAAIASKADGLKKMQLEIDDFVKNHTVWQKTREAQGLLFLKTGMFTNYSTGRIDFGTFVVMHGTGPIVTAIASSLEWESQLE